MYKIESILYDIITHLFIKTIILQKMMEVLD